MQLISITELKRPTWSRISPIDSLRSKPSAEEAREIVETLMNGPSAEDSYDNRLSDKKLSYDSFTPEEIYNTIRRQKNYGSKRAGSSKTNGADNAYLNGYRRQYNQDKTSNVYGNKNNNLRQQNDYDRGGQNTRPNGYKDGPNNRRYAEGNELATNFQKRLGTMMRHRR